MDPIELDGTIISCNAITMTLSISIPSKFIYGGCTLTNNSYVLTTFKTKGMK